MLICCSNLACTWLGLSVAITNTYDYQCYTQITRCRQYTVPLCRIGLPLCSSLYIVFPLQQQSLVQLSVVHQGKALPPEKVIMYITTLKLSELASSSTKGALRCDMQPRCWRERNVLQQ